jgi:hypothetical protein
LFWAKCIYFFVPKLLCQKCRNSLFELGASLKSPVQHGTTVSPFITLPPASQRLRVVFGARTKPPPSSGAGNPSSAARWTRCHRSPSATSAAVRSSSLFFASRSRLRSCFFPRPSSWFRCLDASPQSMCSLAYFVYLGFKPNHHLLKGVRNIFHRVNPQ